MATAPPFVSPQVRSASSPPPETRWGRGAGAEPGNGGGKGQPTLGSGFGPSSQEAPLPLSSLLRPVRSPELCSGPQPFC